MEKRAYNNSLETEFTYRHDNLRLNRIKTRDLQDTNYEYDPVGNVIMMNNSIKNSTNSFEYDDLDRLTKADRKDVFGVTYIYNSIGNIINITYNDILNSNGSYGLSYQYRDNPVHAPSGLICIGDGCYSVTGGILSFGFVFEKGWNLISIPLELKNNSVGILGETEQIFAFNNTDQKHYIPTLLDNKLGYWVKVNQTKNITLTGTEIENNDLGLNDGFNLAGYPSLEKGNVSSILKNSTVYAYNGTWSSYNPNKIFNSLTTLNPGYGYWVKVE